MPVKHVGTVDPDEALRRLVADGVITAEQAEAVRVAQAQTVPRQAGGRWWAEVAGYVGGALVLGAGALLLATTWDRLTDALRGGLLSAITVVLVGSGLALAGGPGQLRQLSRRDAPARRRVVGVLFALASGTGAGAGGVLGEQHASVVAFSVGLLLAAAGYAALPTLPGLLASAGMSMMLGAAVVGELLHADTSFSLGVAYVALGACWALLALVGVVAPRQVALAVGAVIALGGAQLLFGEPGGAPWAYGATFAIAVVSFVGYRLWRDVVLLVAGVIGAAIAAPEAVWDATNGAAGGALVLLVAGIALIAASGLGLGLWRGRDAGTRARDRGAIAS